MPTEIRIAGRDDYSSLADWIVRVSQRPQRQCLHAWSGQDAEDLEGQLLHYLDDGELCYVLALRQGGLVGAMGSEFDRELGRAWLHGPLVAAAEFEPLAGALLERLLQELPDGLTRWDAHLNAANQDGLRFYRGRGFTERDSRSFEFRLDCAERPAAGARDGSPLRREHEASFTALYDALFPEAYYSARRVIEMAGRSHHILVSVAEKEVQGFVVVSLEEGPAAGEIQFLGVREDCRSQGLGRGLLLAAVDWLADMAGVAEITLNVDEALAGARRLYESVGFTLRFVGVGLRKVDGRA